MGENDGDVRDGERGERTVEIEEREREDEIIYLSAIVVIGVLAEKKFQNPSHETHLMHTDRYTISFTSHINTNIMRIRNTHPHRERERE